MSKTGALTGGTAELYKGTQLIACVTDVNWREARQLVRIDVLGVKTSLEILTDGSTCSMSCNAVWFDGRDFGSLGLVDEDGPQTISLPEFTANIKDNATGNLVGKMTGLVLEARGVSFRRGAAVMTDGSFQGIKMAMGKQFG